MVPQFTLLRLRERLFFLRDRFGLIGVLLRARSRILLLRLLTVSLLDLARDFTAASFEFNAGLGLVEEGLEGESVVVRGGSPDEGDDGDDDEVDELPVRVPEPPERPQRVVQSGKCEGTKLRHISIT